MCHHQPLKTAVFSHLSSIHPPTHHVFSTFSELGTVLMKKTGKKLYHESHDSLEKVPLPDFFFFFFGCIGSLLLHAGFLSSCGERGLLFIAVHGLLMAVASPVAEHGL